MSSYWKLIKSNSNLKKLWTAQVVSEAGDWFNTIAVLGLAYHLTGSGLVVTSVLLARAIPVLLAGPLSGILADRMGSRQAMIASDLCRAALALGFLFINNSSTFWLAYVFSAALSILSVLFQSSRSAAIPELCSSGCLASTNALLKSTSAVVQVLGAALGGIAAGLLGYSSAFIANACSFLLSAFLICLIRINAPIAEKISPAKNLAAFGENLKEGFQFVWQNRAVRRLMLIGVGWALGGGAAQVLFSLFALQVFYAGESGMGLLYAVSGSGIVVGSFLASRIPGARMQVWSQWVPGLSLLMTGAFYVGFSLAPTIGAGLIWIFLSRLAMGINHVVVITALMDLISAQLRGRIFALRETALSFTMTASMLLAGIGQQHFDIRIIGALAGIVTAAFGVAWGWTAIKGHAVHEPQV
jgi:MFS family permease